MRGSEPEFTIGIEEEYLLVDRDSLDLAEAPEDLMLACQAELEDQVAPEFLKCQIEIGTKVCKTVSEARDDLRRLRSCVAKHAAQHNLAPIAASCHPFSDWRDQTHTKKERYDSLQYDLQGVVDRMLICGMHVHVGIDDADRRIDLMNQLTYFLPHLLALSCSSPFWQGRDTGLHSYRLTVFDNLPRTGLPPQMSSFSEFERSVRVLTELKVIEDSSKIWWDLRPSSKFPTLESRICDVQPRLEDTLTLAAMTQAITRMLWRLAKKNQRWRMYDAFLVAENRWRAQRYGTSKGLIDLGQGEIVSMPDLMEEMMDLVGEDADVLGSSSQLERVGEIARNGTSSSRQRAVYQAELAAGKEASDAVRAVVQHLVDEFHTDL
jgi:carboxylate-amine ligase